MALEQVARKVGVAGGAVAAVAALLISACGGESLPQDPSAPSTISKSPATTSLSTRAVPRTPAGTVTPWTEPERTWTAQPTVPTTTPAPPSLETPVPTTTDPTTPVEEPQ